MIIGIPWGWEDGWWWVNLVGRLVLHAQAVEGLQRGGPRALDPSYWRHASRIPSCGAWSYSSKALWIWFDGLMAPKLVLMFEASHHQSESVENECAKNLLHARQRPWLHCWQCCPYAQPEPLLSVQSRRLSTCWRTENNWKHSKSLSYRWAWMLDGMVSKKDPMSIPHGCSRHVCAAQGDAGDAWKGAEGRWGYVRWPSVLVQGLEILLNAYVLIWILAGENSGSKVPIPLCREWPSI